MAINEELLTLLLAESTVTDLLTNGTTGGYLDYAPQVDPGDHILIHAISDDPLPALDGTSGMRETELDIDCKASTRVKATALADAVEEYVDDLTGAAGSDTVNAVVANPRAHDVEPPKGAQGNPRFTETVNITCHWTPG